MRARPSRVPPSRPVLSSALSIPLVTRASIRVLALAALSVAAFAGASAQASTEKLAEHLRKLDPGGKVGGKSIVGTKPKQELQGVHGKPNFIIALGDDSTIHGASENDQLGAIGDGAKIVASNHGHSQIVAGPHSEIVVPGKGHSLIVSHAKGATIILESPGDEVIAKGPHDKIVCKHHAHHELIEVAKGGQVSKSCRGHHNAIEHLATSSVRARSSAEKAHASAESCLLPGYPYLSQQVDCVQYEERRTLIGLWASEDVPRYLCPGGHPYLLNVNYVPHLANGVEVEGLGWIGVNIDQLNHIVFAGHEVPLAHGLAPSGNRATNWSLHPDGASYRVILHCTSDPARGYN